MIGMLFAAHCCQLWNQKNIFAFERFSMQHMARQPLQRSIFVMECSKSRSRIEQISMALQVGMSLALVNKYNTSLSKSKFNPGAVTASVNQIRSCWYRNSPSHRMQIKQISTLQGWQHFSLGLSSALKKGLLIFLDVSVHDQPITKSDRAAEPITVRQGTTEANYVQITIQIWKCWQGQWV